MSFIHTTESGRQSLPLWLTPLVVGVQEYRCLRILTTSEWQVGKEDSRLGSGLMVSKERTFEIGWLWGTWLIASAMPRFAMTADAPLALDNVTVLKKWKWHEGYGRSLMKSCFGNLASVTLEPDQIHFLFISIAFFSSRVFFYVSFLTWFYFCRKVLSTEMPLGPIPLWINLLS